MKKINILFFALTLSISVKAGNFYLRAGIDLLPTYDEVTLMGKFKITEKTGKDLASDISAEYTFNITPKWELGLGVATQNHANISNKPYPRLAESGFYRNSNLSTGSIPIYLTSKFNFDELNNGTKLYIKSDLGYSFINSSDRLYQYKSVNSLESEKIELSFNQSLYAGFGLGIEYNNFLFDIMLKVNTLKLEIDGTKASDGDMTHFSDNMNINYSRIVATIGYKF